MPILPQNLKQPCKTIGKVICSFEEDVVKGIEVLIRDLAKAPMLGGEVRVGLALQALNAAFAGANRNGMLIRPLSDDDMLTVECDFLNVTITGTAKSLAVAREKYVALLRKKGVPEELLPSRDQ